MNGPEPHPITQEEIAELHENSETYNGATVCHGEWDSYSPDGWPTVTLRKDVLRDMLKAVTQIEHDDPRVPVRLSLPLSGCSMKHDSPIRVAIMEVGGNDEVVFGCPWMGHIDDYEGLQDTYVWVGEEEQGDGE